MEGGYCTRYGEVDVRCIGERGQLDLSEDAVRDVYGDELVSVRGAEMQEVLGELLAERGETLATAESCTGGKISNLITNGLGAS